MHRLRVIQTKERLVVRSRFGVGVCIYLDIEYLYNLIVWQTGIQELDQRDYHIT